MVYSAIALFKETSQVSFGTKNSSDRGDVSVTSDGNVSSEISLGEFYDNEHVGPGSEKRTESAARDDLAKTPLVRAFIPCFSLLKNEPMQPLFQLFQ